MQIDKERAEVLERAEPVHTETYRRHLTLFIDSFVIKAKRDRWRHLLLERPDKAPGVAHKMHDDLVWSLCSRIGDERVWTSQKTHGVFTDFSGTAQWLALPDAFRVGHGHESIFSMTEGRLALYFWHELEDYVCKR